MPVRSHRPSARQVGILALALASLTLFSVLVPLQTSAYGTALPLSFLLSAALCGAPPLMLTHPRLGALAVVASTLALGLLVDPGLVRYAPWPWSVPALLAFLLAVGVATSVHGARVGAVPLVLGLSGSLITVLLRPAVIDAADVAASVTANLIVAASVAATVYVITLLLAGRLRVGAELDRERELSAAEHERRLLVEERTRIARDLHDVVAHSMSLIQVQASTARYRVSDLPDAAAQEFDGIAATARTSLTEMRRLLGVLRTEDTAERAPQRGLADVPALVDGIRRSGTSVSLEQRTDAEGIPAGVDLAAFRIVQEALSNALRHADGAPIAVSLDLGDGALRVRVRNARGAEATSGDAAPSPTTGHGLRGMRERAVMLGGTVQASATPDGGWLVDARLPLDTPDTQEAL
ncbi:sensor histidine kinase [Microbacterium sp. Mu-80]|uniref:histidine kinase n=1 Tax=Microbacterium bandirmense TaxID=3122050 RepID=A0ABU8L8Q8_9MICO